MNETGKNEFIIKKSYEISYALWRIAANIETKAFAERLRGRAIKLIDSAVIGNFGAIIETANTIDFFIKFGVDVNAISPTNGDILIREIGNLKSAIPSIINTANGDIDIADIFSDELPESPEAIDIPYTEETQVDLEEDDDFKPIAIAANNIKAEIRQSMILEKIRQIGNCRLSDIQEILPDTSERTIRYDLEALVQKGAIDRVGIGGRGVYYRVK